MTNRVGSASRPVRFRASTVEFVSSRKIAQNFQHLVDVARVIIAGNGNSESIVSHAAYNATFEKF
jgi:hypothetical protein